MTSFLPPPGVPTKVLPSRELTYPSKMGFWRWFSFSRLVGYVNSLEGTQFFMNYIWHLICATSISFGTSIPPPHMSATWPRYIRWLQTSKNPIFRQHAPVPESEVNEPNEPSSRKAQQQKIQKLQKKSQFCCEQRTIVEDWRGMVVVNWMIFFFN